MKKIFFCILPLIFLIVQISAQSIKKPSYQYSLKHVSKQIVHKMALSNITTCSVEEFVNPNGNSDRVGFYLKHKVMNHIMALRKDFTLIDSSRKSVIKNETSKKKFKKKATPIKKCFLKGRYLVVGKKVTLFIQLTSGEQNKVLMIESYDIPAKREFSDILGRNSHLKSNGHASLPMDEKGLRHIIRDEFHQLLIQYNYFKQDAKPETVSRKEKPYYFKDLHFTVKNATRNEGEVYVEVWIENMGTTNTSYRIDDVHLYSDSHYNFKLEKDQSRVGNVVYDRGFQFKLAPEEGKKAVFHFKDGMNRLKVIQRLELAISQESGTYSRKDISLKNISFLAD